MSPREDNLFQESSMSFGDHLEELRGCLFRCILGIVVCFIIGLFFGAQVMNIVQQPLTRSLTRYLDKQNQAKIAKMVEQGYPKDIAEKAFNSGLLVETVYLNKSEISRVAASYAAPSEDSSATPLEIQPVSPETVINADNSAVTQQTDTQQTKDNSDKTAADKLENSGAEKTTAEKAVKETETEETAIEEKSAEEKVDSSQQQPSYTKAIAWFADWWNYACGSLPAIQTQDQISQFEKNRNQDFVKVYLWKPKDESERTHTRSLSAQEPFMIYVKASLLVGVVLSCPWVLYQIWMFIISGLYPHERKYVYIYFPISMGLFLAGASMAFFWVFDPVLGFLMLFNEWMKIEPDLRINEWLGFVLMLPIGFGISFQLPLVMLFLERIGIISIKMYMDNWRVAILIIAVLSMVLTPADPTSMLLMFTPLTILFFLGLLMCKYMPRGSK